MWRLSSKTAASSAEEEEWGSALWEEVVAQNGKTYYWNTKTGAAQWEKPVEGGEESP